ncbi:peptidase M23B [Clostridium acetobutylicum]|nr:peptidase M23B [Clostridium acetobutylicum]
MAAELVMESIEYEKTVGQNIVDTVVKEEYVIPDTRPDVKQILMVDAKPKIINTEIMQDKVYVEGQVEFNVIYLGTGDSKNDVYGVNYTSKFSNYIDIVNCERDMICNVKPYVEHMNCNIVNERKICVQGIIEIKGKVNKVSKIEMVKDVVGIGEVQFLRNKTKIDNIIGKTTIDLIAKSNIQIPSDKEQIDEILRCDVSVHKKNVKVSDGKIEANANALVEILYKAKDSGQINYISDDVEISGEESIDGSDPTMDNDSIFRVDAYEFNVKQDDLGENRIISTEAIVKCDAKVINRMEINSIDDVYSPETVLDVKKKDYRINMIKEHAFSEAIVKENIEVPSEYPNPSGIVAAYGKVIVTDKKVFENKVSIEGILNVSVLYRTSDKENNVYALNEDIPFANSAEIEGCKIDMVCDVRANIENIESTLEANTIAIKSLISFDQKVSYENDRSFIVNVEPSEDGIPEKKASITIYCIQDGDSLWKIAKNYATTVESIVKANNIEDENLVAPGQKLIIPGRAVI